jgi:hypothetical protein
MDLSTDSQWKLSQVAMELADTFSDFRYPRASIDESLGCGGNRASQMVVGSVGLTTTSGHEEGSSDDPVLSHGTLCDLDHGTFAQAGRAELRVEP